MNVVVFNASRLREVRAFAEKPENWIASLDDLPMTKEREKAHVGITLGVYWTFTITRILGVPHRVLTAVQNDDLSKEPNLLAVLELAVELGLRDPPNGCIPIEDPRETHSGVRGLMQPLEEP